MFCFTAVEGLTLSLREVTISVFSSTSEQLASLYSFRVWCVGRANTVFHSLSREQHCTILIRGPRDPDSYIVFFWATFKAIILHFHWDHYCFANRCDWLLAIDLLIWFFSGRINFCRVTWLTGLDFTWITKRFMGR